MFGLPNHSIILIDKQGKKECVCDTDCNSRSEVIESINYLVSKCHYNLDNYVKAQYIAYNDIVIYEYDIKNGVLVEN